MKNIFARIGALVALASLAAIGTAQTLTVTSPTNGQFLGANNTLRFNITGINTETKVKYTASGPGGSTSNEQSFFPNAQQEIEGTMPLNFSQGAPEGSYTIVVEAKRLDTNVIFGTATITVTLDVNKPKFLQINRINGAFVRGVVPITVMVLEPNFKDYRVQVNGQDIPNNTGTSLVNNSFTVLWDTAGIESDGLQTVTIRLRDNADNEENRNLNLTLDRIAPTISVLQPLPNVTLRPRTSVSVAFDIIDGSAFSVSGEAIDVVARTMSGQFIARVSRQSARPTGGNLRWTGRVRYRSSLPAQFKIVINVTDKAGNPATPQEVIVRYQQ